MTAAFSERTVFQGLCHPTQKEGKEQRSAQARVQILFQVKEVYVDGGVNVFGLLWAYIPKFPLALQSAIALSTTSP